LLFVGVQPKAFAAASRDDGEMNQFQHRITVTPTLRRHARCYPSGAARVQPRRFTSFPLEDDEHVPSVCRDAERSARWAELARRAEDQRWDSQWRWRFRYLGECKSHRLEGSSQESRPFGVNKPPYGAAQTVVRSF
jgi:hypothetical protein